MFDKETDKLESFLGKNSNFKGELNVQGTLRVDGRVEGQLDADYLILSESAVVKGEIKAKRLIVGGTIDGCIRAQELVGNVNRILTICDNRILTTPELCLKIEMTRVNHLTPSLS